MSFPDPFDNPPAAPAPAQAPAPAPAPAEAPQQSPWDNTPAAPAAQSAAPVVAPAAGTGDLSVTFKGDGSYSAAWIVPKYASVDEALVDLGVDPVEVAKLGQGQKWFALFDRAKKMNDHYASLGGGTPPPANNGGGGQPQQQSRAPQQAQEAPGGEKRFCSHGEMVFKSGVSKAGNAYQLFSCTAPRDQQCKPQYLNNRR
ncbi:hypothetical protein SEA_SUPERCHUNK_49 [Mycobacterium phage Superchunk]|nr:hypothetical protein SEA_SUPERCHUNK_49 [Mycobacterium phage Superchunk]